MYLAMSLCFQRKQFSRKGKGHGKGQKSAPEALTLTQMIDANKELAEGDQVMTMRSELNLSNTVLHIQGVDNMLVMRSCLPGVETRMPQLDFPLELVHHTTDIPPKAGRCLNQNVCMDDSTSGPSLSLSGILGFDIYGISCH